MGKENGAWRCAWQTAASAAMTGMLGAHPLARSIAEGSEAFYWVAYGAITAAGLFLTALSADELIGELRKARRRRRRGGGKGN